MPSSCGAYGCTNWGNENREISFHNLPSQKKASLSAKSPIHVDEVFYLRLSEETYSVAILPKVPKNIAPVENKTERKPLHLTAHNFSKNRFFKVIIVCIYFTKLYTQYFLKDKGKKKEGILFK